MDQVKNIIGVVNNTEVSITKLIKEKTTGLFNKDSISPPPIKILYTMTLSKSGKVLEMFNLKPFTAFKERSFDLHKILRTINYYLLQDESDVKMARILSQQLQKFQRGGGKGDDNEYWCYVLLLQIVGSHLYNNDNHFSYASENEQDIVSCDLFSFEYLMTLFSLACRALERANNNNEEVSNRLKWFKDTILILEYMISYSSLEIQHAAKEKLCYISSPSSISSSSNNTINTTTPKLSERQVKSDFSHVQDYFGGQKGLSLILKVVKAKRLETLYHHGLSKLGLTTTREDLNMDTLTQLIESKGDDHVLFQDILSLSKAVLIHYEEALKEVKSPLTCHEAQATRQFYHVLFMSHFWFCKHHFLVCIYDSFLYKTNKEKGGAAHICLRHAQSVLARVAYILENYGVFIEKYTLFVIDNSQEMVSNIISSSLLSLYQTLLRNIKQLDDDYYTIVYDIHKKTIDNITLDVIKEKVLPNNTMSPSSFLDLYIQKASTTHLPTSFNAKAINERLTALKRQYFNQMKGYQDGGEEGEGEGMELTKHEKGIAYNERKNWLSYLYSHYDKENGVIVIPKKDSLEIINEYTMYI